MSNNETEKRGLSVPVEVRADDDGTVRVEGYAAVFGEEADIGGMFREVIERGAFSDVLDQDTVFVIEHAGLPLARTRSGTLKLTEDGRGLRIESELDGSDPDVARIVPKMKRGDLDKMSFAFRAGVQEWDDTQDPPLRTIKKVERLYDVSVVTEPAYEGTEIALRSLERHRKTSNFRAASKRLRLKKNLDLRMVQRKA
jgi:HK97 family phage prohead protease